MGILNFLRNLGKEKEELQKVRLEELTNLAAPLSEKALERAKSELDQLRVLVDKEKEESKKNVSALESAEFKNKELPERVKQIAQGNRETFLQKIEGLLSNFIVPEEFDKVLGFTEEFDKTMADFSRSIGKSHNVMSELFAKEAGAISVNIQKIDELVKKMKKTVDAPDIKKFRELEGKILEVENKIKQNEENKKKIGDDKKDLELEESEVKKKEENLEAVRTGEEQLAFLKLGEDRDALKLKLESLKREVLHSFSEIEAALKRFSNLNKEDELSKSYLSNSLGAILEDKDLEFVDLAKKIKTYISEGSIELKDKKKTSALNELEKLDEEYFKTFLEKQKEMKDGIKKFGEEISNASVVKKLEEAGEDLVRVQAKLDSKKKEVSELAEEIESFNVEELKKDLEKEFNEKTGKNVEIV